MTIQHSRDFGIERAGRMLKDISGKASIDSSGNLDEMIMMNHMGRSLGEVDRGGRGGRVSHDFKNSRPEGVEILVLDNFKADENGEFHGKRVAYVAKQALSQPDVEVLRQKMHDQPHLIVDQLLKIAGSENPPEVINISFGQSPSYLFQDDFIEFNEDFREKHGEDDSQWSAGIHQEYKDEVQKMANRAVEYFDEHVGDLPQKFEKAFQALLDKGVTVVIAEGNSGEMATLLNGLGLEIPDRFFSSGFGEAVKADGVIMVAATDAEGKPAYDSSPTGFTDVAAQGDQVPVNRLGDLESGTSYSAPKVAALAADILAIRPELTPADVEAIIRQSASPVAGAEMTLGAGIVNPDKARELARGWAPGEVCIHPPLQPQMQPWRHRSEP